MQKFFLQFLSVTLIGTMIFFTACADDTTDGGGGGSDDAPSASLVASTGLINDNAEVAPGSIFKVQLKLQAGTDKLKTFKILEEGVNLPTTRFTITSGGVTITPNNPFLLVGAVKDGATYEISIQAHSDISTKRYTFEVTDDKNRTDQVAVNITTKGAELTEFTGKLLYNQDGPTGQGGLDLDTGESVGSLASNTGNPAVDTSFKRAEINDEGNVTGSTTVWRQVISPTNGAAVRYIDKSKLPENFSYESVTTQEQVIGAFDSGIKFNEVRENGVVVDFESNKLAVNDVFTVKTADNRYFIIKVTKITPTATDNNDFYTFSIKKKK